MSWIHFARAATVLVSAALCLASPALAQTPAYPSKPIRIVVGYPPGGSADVTARLLADALRQSLGQNVVVENLPGASGNIAAQNVARASPDGYTLLLGNTGEISINKFVMKDTGFNPDADLAPIAIVYNIALLKQVSAEDRQRRGWYSNTIRVTCRVRSRLGSGTGSVLGVIRIAGARANRGEIGQCLGRDVVPTLARVPRIGAVWLLENDASIRARMDEARVTGHQDGSADWAVLIEAGHEAHVQAATAKLADVTLWRALELSRAAVFDRYRLLYTMTQTRT